MVVCRRHCCCFGARTCFLPVVGTAGTGRTLTSHACRALRICHVRPSARQVNDVSWLGPVNLELGEVREGAEVPLVLFGEVSGFGIEYAQRPDAPASRAGQGMTGVEADRC